MRKFAEGIQCTFQDLLRKKVEFVGHHRRILDTASFVMFLGGFVGIYISVLVHGLLSHQFGWVFSYGAVNPFEAAVTEICFFCCVFASSLGLLIGVVLLGGWGEYPSE